MAITWYTSRLTAVKQETPQTRRFYFEIPELASYDFQPGQFVNFELPISEVPRERTRSYSIASHPDGSNQIEFAIVRFEGGKGTGYLFDELQVGQELKVSAANGRLTLPEEVDFDICYICTGTGLAPFRSHLLDLHHKQKAHKKIDLIFGTRTRQDVLYWDELQQLQKDMDGFTYHPVLSREESEGCSKGYVHQVYESLYADRHGDPNLRFYLCGWEDMVKEARKRLVEMGFNRKQIKVEIYG